MGKGSYGIWPRDPLAYGVLCTPQGEGMQRAREWWGVARESRMLGRRSLRVRRVKTKIRVKGSGRGRPLLHLGCHREGLTELVESALEEEIKPGEKEVISAVRLRKKVATLSQGGLVQPFYLGVGGRSSGSFLQASAKRRPFASSSSFNSRTYSVNFCGLRSI